MRNDPLADAGILLHGIAADDARLRLLLDRITQYGAAPVDTPDADCHDFRRRVMRRPVCHADAAEHPRAMPSGGVWHGRKLVMS